MKLKELFSDDFMMSLHESFHEALSVSIPITVIYSTVMYNSLQCIVKGRQANSTANTCAGTVGVFFALLCTPSQSEYFISFDQHSCTCISLTSFYPISCNETERPKLDQITS